MDTVPESNPPHLKESVNLPHLLFEISEGAFIFNEGQYSGIHEMLPQTAAVHSRNIYSLNQTGQLPMKLPTSCPFTEMVDMWIYMCVLSIHTFNFIDPMELIN